MRSILFGVKLVLLAGFIFKNYQMIHEFFAKVILVFFASFIFKEFYDIYSKHHKITNTLFHLF